MKPQVLVLAGDGIGPEITAAALRVLDELGSFSFEHGLVGGASIDVHGEPLTDELVALARACDSILFGAVGGPKWDSSDPAAPRAERGLLQLRQELGLFANLRPVRPHPLLLDASPLRRERLEGVDLLIVRELTGGLYFGARGHENGSAFDTCTYTDEEVERVARVAFSAARRGVTSVDKFNVLDTSRLWRAVVERVHAEEYPDVPLDHLLVDNAAMQLVTRPADFDVVVTENMFGDILSDQAAVLSGSIGLLPSASVGPEDGPGLFEPIHGSAPDIAGTAAANPIAMFLSAALMLRHKLGLAAEAEALEAAVARTLDDRIWTPDLGGSNTTEEVTDGVIARLGN
jgi:3-isopropylmalate dehydrogenase